VLGGVETFRDASAMVQDLERAKAIQQLALTHQMPHDPRVQFTTHYVPHEIVGGDFYAIRQVSDHQYGLILADVMGHGIAAALYTMHLSQLWERHHGLLSHPVEFAATMNNELAKVVKTDESFATAICGLVDLEQREFRFAGAGGAQVLVMHRDGTYACPECSGLPLAVMEDAPYDEVSVPITAGDHLLMFSDGAIEIHNAEGQMLDIHGLIAILRQQGYPQAGIDMARLEEALLKYSNSIRLEDDLTILEVRLLDS
jgi:serine phosphatase RsbU (regulator of sigma subunit)